MKWKLGRVTYLPEELQIALLLLVADKRRSLSLLLMLVEEFIVHVKEPFQVRFADGMFVADLTALCVPRQSLSHGVSGQRIERSHRSGVGVVRRWIRGLES